MKELKGTKTEQNLKARQEGARGVSYLRPSVKQLPD